MTLVWHVVVVIMLVGFLLWLVNVKFPMESTVKSILNVFVTGALVFWILKVTGLLAKLH